MPQQRLKIPHAATKARCSQITKYFLKKDGELSLSRLHVSTLMLFVLSSRTSVLKKKKIMKNKKKTTSVTFRQPASLREASERTPVVSEAAPGEEGS